MFFVLVNSIRGLLYEHQDPHRKRGPIGFYANQGRAHVKNIIVRDQPLTTTLTTTNPHL
jgi:hypothetical protein